MLEQEPTLEYYSSFLVQYKGIEGFEDTTTAATKPNFEQFMLMSIDNALYSLYRSYITELGEIDNIQIVFILNNHSAYYAFTKDNIFKQQNLLLKLD